MGRFVVGLAKNPPSGRDPRHSQQKQGGGQAARHPTAHPAPRLWPYGGLQPSEQARDSGKGDVIWLGRGRDSILIQYPAHPPPPATPPCVLVRTRYQGPRSLAAVLLASRGRGPSSNSAARRRRGVFHCRHSAALSRKRTQRVRQTSTAGVSVSSLPASRASPVNSAEKSMRIWMFCAVSSVRLMAYWLLFLIRAFGPIHCSAFRCSAFRYSECLTSLAGVMI